MLRLFELARDRTERRLDRGAQAIDDGNDRDRNAGAEILESYLEVLKKLDDPKTARDVEKRLEEIRGLLARKTS